MNSNHGIPTFADACSKGLKVDVKAAYEAGRKALREKTLVPWCGNPAGELDRFYWEHGYMPALREGESETDPNVNGWEKRQPVEALNAKSFDGKKITVTGYFNGISGKGRYINIIATKIDEYVDNPKGTLTNPYTPEEICGILLGGETISENVYVKGIVCQTTKYNYGSTYNTASFWISGDGSFNDDKTKEFEAYSIYWLGSDIDNPTQAADINGNFAVGDEVVLYGKVTTYNGTAETSSKKASLYSLNGATE